jgi:hypothetical protein
MWLRWLLASLGALCIAWFAYSMIEVEESASLPAATRRPIGTPADILALRDRDDVNVMFILIDTLRAHRMSVYGYERDTTPFMRALAKTSVVFDRNIAQSSWTKSSMASLWSGLYPLRVGITKFNHTISQEFEMPAEIFKEAGFFTVAMYRNGWVHGYFGFDQGFDRYYRPLGSRADRQAGRGNPNVLSVGTDESMAHEAEEFLRIHGKTSRWFLYLHMMDLHEYVYDEESALFGTTTSDLYDNSIVRSDWIVSSLFASLHRFGLLDKTIVVIASDHGEAFGERGFDGHAREVLPETTETPLIVSLPYELEGGVEVSSPTSNADIWPTILDLLGLPLPGGDIDGRSRVPEILVAMGSEIPSEPRSETAAIVSYLDQNWGQNVAEVAPAISVIEGDYRFVAGKRASGDRFEALFSVEDGQRANRIGKEEEVASRLRSIAEVHLEIDADFGVEAVEMDEMQLDQLRALGYDLH